MLSTAPFYFQQFHKDGEPLSGGKLYTYIGGSTNAPKATFVDPNGATESSNPIILSSQGICPQFWCEAGLYKFVLTDSSGNEIASRDYVDGIGGGAAITGDYKVMVNSSDTPTYLRSKVYADGGLVVQEVKVSPGTYKMHLFPDSSVLQAKPTGPAGGDLAGTYPDPIVKQLTGIEAALLPVASDFTFSTSPAGTGIGPGKQFVAGVEVRCWVAMGFDGRLRWTRNDFASTILDTGLWSRNIGSNWNCIRFLYMPTFSSWAWVAGDGVHAYVYYALHAPANYNTDGTIKAAAWSSINYGASIAYPPNMGDVAQGMDHVSCFVGNDSTIGRTADFSTFVCYNGAGQSFGGIDTDGYGAWLAIRRDTGGLFESVDNGLTWASVALISVDGSPAANLPCPYGTQWGSINCRYGAWIASVYYSNDPSAPSYAYSYNRREWFTFSDTTTSRFFSAAFDGRKWFATNPEISPPIWQLLFSEIPAHKRLICEDGLIASGTTFLPDLPSAQVLATDHNGLLVAQDWIDLSSYSNASEYRVGGTVVIDSTQNVKGTTLWSGGAIRIDANGDGTLRNLDLTGDFLAAHQCEQWASERVSSSQYVKTADTTIGPNATAKASLLNGSTSGFTAVSEPAGRWNAVGAQSDIQLKGKASSVANQVLVFELYRNGASVAALTLPARTYGTNTPWRLEIDQDVRVAGASGTVRVDMRAYATADNASSQSSCYQMDSTLTGVDLTAAATWDVVCTIPNNAANSITCIKGRKVG